MKCVMIVAKKENSNNTKNLPLRVCYSFGPSSLSYHFFEMQMKHIKLISLWLPKFLHIGPNGMGIRQKNGFMPKAIFKISMMMKHGIVVKKAQATQEQGKGSATTIIKHVYFHNERANKEDDELGQEEDEENEEAEGIFYFYL
ncbi:hypothetical protein ACJX0J_040421, partial [Zea mays]